jgi:hypothetical protein
MSVGHASEEIDLPALLLRKGAFLTTRVLWQE